MSFHQLRSPRFNNVLNPPEIEEEEEGVELTAPAVLVLVGTVAAVQTTINMPDEP